MQDSAAVLPSAAAHDEAPRAFDVARLLAPAQALTVYFAGTSLGPPAIETISLADCFGRVLARDAVAREDHPAHARSTMDGYAVRGGDHRAERRVIGEIAMGAQPTRALGVDEALRIPTGGALPAGADAVVPQEDAERTGDTILVHARVAPGEFVTQAGEDIRAGEAVLGAGRRIGASELGVLATLGMVSLPVYRQPRIGIISTGDELVAPDRAPGPGQVRDSNRYALAGALAALGAKPVHLPHAADTREALRAAVHDGLDACDGLVLTGGSSVGDRDLVPRVVAELATPGIVVHGLRVKPGKPTLLAAAGSKPIIGLPGNPTSSLMILEAVARPIILAMTGQTLRPPLPLEALASAPFAGREGWTWYVPVRLSLFGGALLAHPLALRSAHTSLLARASGYAILGETEARIEAGERVAVYSFVAGGAPVEIA
ncbi:MAG: molybdopterin molybdotransferase MoeA [Candidatus Eremiobacteraeota bacterium]|nr:molybdopterin molybdotransferase MoeA [Candidatus Eremiobacteraeota bacterium]MBC5803392.1 molybdopterin molybdotransferase MoeA [Candidatus Eremiobacteraeota bacterium]MBC5822516.1 molybdopterin molybdotransferase MoeA [Candidatus Eremiobacteraeota bacterium]